MAESKFPFLAPSIWWALRKKFNSTIPKEVSPSYVATAFNMSEVSAKTNVLPKLRQIGLIDDNRKPTELAIQWRDDDQYPEICKKLIDDLYPSELVEAIDDPLSNRDRVVKWFQNKSKVGEQAAIKMARFYFLLVESDPNKSNEVNAKVDKSKSSKPRPKAIAEAVGLSNKANVDIKKSNPQAKHPTSTFSPSLHLDIQIHISPDASSDQIDKIFESMAKHLTGFRIS